MPRRKQNKQNPFLSLIILVSIVVGLTVVNAPASSTNSRSPLPYILILSVLLSISAIIVVLWVERHKLLTLKAIRTAAIDSMDGVQFERYVGALLTSRGYRVQYTKASGDLGVDIVAKKKGVATAIQVKRYRSVLGQDAIRQAVAGMSYCRCKESMVITNSTFTASAKLLAASNHCELIDRMALGEWISAFQAQG